MRVLALLLILGTLTCEQTSEKESEQVKVAPAIPIVDKAEWNEWDNSFSMADLPWIPKPQFSTIYDSLFFEHPGFVSDGFDFPLGKPHGKGYYIAQGFGTQKHLGEDWNAVTGGNSDLGDTISAISHGYVLYAGELGGRWGKTARIVHKMPNGKLIESVYAHCNALALQKGQWIERGKPIGTVGTAGGRFLAHLHLELRDSVGMPMRTGYSSNTKGYLIPSHFIQANRHWD